MQDIHYQGHELKDSPAPLGYHWKIEDFANEFHEVWYGEISFLREKITFFNMIWNLLLTLENMITNI